MLFRLYTSKCNRKGCAGHITNTTHLREVHKFNVNVRAILEQFKDKKTKATARLTVIRTIEFIERIRVKTARK
jgi:rRNA-processing protein FCF1